MQFNEHKNLSGLHSVFSPSQPSWLRYDDEKALEVKANKQAAEMGSRFHAWAKNTIDLGIKQAKSKNTLSMYVNDAIGYKMSTEVVLFYSENFFGTADAISFRNNFLRIHDLKTGNIPGKMEQLEIYAALFCLEYKLKPAELAGMELRLYQFDKALVNIPEPEDILIKMNRIVYLDKLFSDNY